MKRRDPKRDAKRDPSGDEARTRGESARAPRGGEKAETAGDEIAQLRKQVAELTETRQRLSRLYFNQVEENRKRAQKLHQILENIGEINAGLDLDAMLPRLAETIRATLGFRVVLIRLRDPGSPVLRARAFAGIETAGREALAATDVKMEDFLSWLREEFRVSRSYFISHTNAFSETLPAGYTAELGQREEWEWHPKDVLLVPLFSRGGELIAYFSVDDPVDRLVPSTETIEMLEIFGHHAVVAIENARLYRQSERYARDLEEAGRRMQEVHALRTNFVSTVSHELRTPLTAIRAYLETLLELGQDGIPQEKLTHFLKIISEESDRLARLIESILDLNRLDAANRRKTRQSVDLAEVVHDTVRMLALPAEARHVSIKVATETADTRLNADRDQLRQLALHLGMNAVKFTPEGGTVTFAVKGDGRDVSLCVEDTGIGIPPEALSRVFERFYQVDTSPGRQHGGVGLGLAICKAIVDSHGGRLFAESTPGKGSRFTAVLPRRTAARVIVRPRPEPRPALEEVLRMAVEMVADVMNARVVSILSLEPEGDLVVEAGMGLEEAIVRDIRVKSGTGVAGWVAQHRHPVCVSRPQDKAEVNGSGRAHYSSGTFLSVPLEGREGPIGVLNVTDPVSSASFRAEECHLLLQLAERVAVAWESARHADAAGSNGDGGQSFDEVAHELRDALEQVGTGHESADRARLARSLARAIGLTESEIGAISYAASLDDGDSPGDGEGPPRALESMSLVRDVLLSQHEWWDGTGYPRGLKAVDIPIGGRILAVVDAYERMTAGRPNRPARPKEEALEEIRRLRGRQFDPAVVDGFERLRSVLDETRVAQAPEPRGAGVADTGR
ncbi:MAG TPA: ATP-binding protein [Candidatus Eisenbacteria bacterium]